MSISTKNYTIKTIEDKEYFFRGERVNSKEHQDGRTNLS
jgi:hypothetical protein